MLPKIESLFIFFNTTECAYGDQDFIDDSEFKQEEHKDDLDFKPPGMLRKKLYHYQCSIQESRKKGIF